MPVEKGQIATGLMGHERARRTGMREAAVRTVVEQFLTLIQEELTKKSRVVIVNFGTFERKIWRQKPVYDFLSKTTRKIDLPFIRFTPSRTMDHAVHVQAS